MRKLGLVLVLLLAAAFLVAAPIESPANPAVEKPVEKPMTEGQAPNTAYIKSTVEQGKIIRINAEWRYKVYVNGEQVIDPFVSMDRWHLSSFTIYKRVYDGTTYDGQGFSLINLNGESPSQVCDLSSAQGRSYSTSYDIDSTTGILQKITTSVAFIAPCGAAGILPLRLVRDGSGWDWYGLTSHGYFSNADRYPHGSLYIPGNFTKDMPYRVTLVDNGIHNFSASAEIPITSDSYLYLLRGFFKDDSDPTFTLESASGTTHSPEVQWGQQKLSWTSAKMTIRLINNSQSPWTVKRVIVRFDNVQYGKIEFENEITLNPADYIELVITIVA